MRHIPVGTKVKVAEDLEPLRNYDGVLFSKTMVPYCGQVVTIASEKEIGVYTIHEDNQIFWWTECMFDLEDEQKTTSGFQLPRPVSVAKDAIEQIDSMSELAYLLDGIQSRLNEATQKDANFLTDTDKMYDFLRIDKDSFLESYLYLTEEEYDNTKRMYHAALCAYFDFMSEKTHRENGIEFHPCFCPKKQDLEE